MGEKFKNKNKLDDMELDGVTGGTIQYQPDIEQLRSIFREKNSTFVVRDSNVHSEVVATLEMAKVKPD